MPPEIEVDLVVMPPLEVALSLVQGPSGPPGPDGPTGPQGPAGPGASALDSHYQHSQGVPSAVWSITHNLGKRPAITVIDSAGDEVEGEVKHVDVNHAVVSFSAPFSGIAICN